MYLAKVIGNVVSTHKEEKIENVALLLVDKIDPKTCKVSGAVAVAIDSVGAGPGEYVLVVTGSSARMTQATNGRPCDAAIMAIVDIIEVNGEFTYQKGVHDPG
ncbi:MAG: EutN/CcmL family microcompartment protein [Leptospiraceae bacterium]|nr:EutN/CcmL family microcompartment protein [Leptospiraceae bacterium]MCB1199335.1 EutN/CcmL family microcompartment protein [Leptospiraceae bacterium]